MKQNLFGALLFILLGLIVSCQGDENVKKKETKKVKAHLMMSEGEYLWVDGDQKLLLPSVHFKRMSQKFVVAKGTYGFNSQRIQAERKRCGSLFSYIIKNDSAIEINDHRVQNSNRVFLQTNYRWFYVDSLGNRLSSKVYKTLVHVVSSQYSIVDVDSLPKSWLIDTNENLKFELKCSWRKSHVKVISDSMFAVKDFDNKIGRWGIYHYRKGLVKDHIYSYVGKLSDGMILVDIDGDRKGYGYLDTMLNVVIPVGFLDRFLASMVGNKWKESQCMLSEDYDALNFFHGFARYFVVKDGKKYWGYVNKSGAVSLNHFYSYLPRWEYAGVIAERDSVKVRIDKLL